MDRHLTAAGLLSFAIGALALAVLVCSEVKP